MFHLTSKRLALRNLTDSDLDFIRALRTDESCARYQRWEDNSPEHIQAMIDEHRADDFLSEKEIQRFVISRTDGAPVGTLTLFVTPSEGCITLGITVTTPNQRQGYAGEMLSAVIDRIRTSFSALEIVALIHPDNLPSVRLFESLGFQLDLYAESIKSLVYTLRT